MTRTGTASSSGCGEWVWAGQAPPFPAESSFGERRARALVQLGHELEHGLAIGDRACVPESRFSKSAITRASTSSRAAADVISIATPGKSGGSSAPALSLASSSARTREGTPLSGFRFWATCSSLCIGASG
jgi:hypothetical protein